MTKDEIVIAVFTSACQKALTSPEFEKKRSEIKSLFVQRNFTAIFGNPDLLETYTADYAPSRALCYNSLFSRDYIQSILKDCSNILCLGGGAGSEMIGIGSAIESMSKSFTIVLQDIADYSVVFHSLKEAFDRLIKPKATIQFEHSIYDVTCNDLLQKQVENSQFITAFFILNEILSNSKKDFAKLLFTLVKSMKKGAYLFIVDSAGSFSESKVGQQTVMCYNLIDPISEFSLVHKSDSEWYRLDPKLRYASKLNNMRYFQRLYQKK